MSLLSLTRPSASAITQLVTGQSGAPLTYDCVGQTNGPFPEGWSTDDQRVVIGQGQADFDRAVCLLRQWVQFDLPWVWLLERNAPLVAGQVVSFLSHQYGVWSVNICRIVYVVDTHSADHAAFGFAYGTVGTHGVRGEERFLIEWDRTIDRVTFGIRKFSLPASWLLTVLGPITRSVQARFTRDALARFAQAMRA